MPVRHLFAAAFLAASALTHALVKHDPAGLPLNRDVKFTENTARLKVGSEGLWVGASLPYGTKNGWGD